MINVHSSFNELEENFIKWIERKKKNWLRNLELWFLNLRNQLTLNIKKVTFCTVADHIQLWRFTQWILIV